MNHVVFSSAPQERHDTLRVALSSAGLPTDDLDQPGRLFFELADEAGPIGFVGIEGNGADRLLRSLVVLGTRQRRGHGRVLVAQAEALARRDGVQRLHLLTTTAASFFHELGYGTSDRNAAPQSIASSAEFAMLCPASATYMTKALA